MAADPATLWREAGGDPERYRELMHEHGLLLRPGDPGYEKGSRQLPCQEDKKISWSATPLAKVPDWTPEQAFGAEGSCESCGRKTWLRPDPYVQQLVCRPCWEALMFGDEDEA